MPETRNKHPSKLRWLAVAGLAIAAACWSGLYYRAVSARQSWLDLYREEGSAFLASQDEGGLPVDSRIYVAQARFLSERSFPPRYDAGQSLLGSALGRAPLESQVWLLAARVRFFQGRLDEARAALEHSGNLQPAHTARRLGAVELWELMGDRERALEVALQIARTGNRGRQAAVREMRWMGLGAEDIYDLVGGGGLTASESMEVVGRLAPLSLEEVGALAARFPAEFIEDAVFRQWWATVLSKQLVIDEAWRTWQAEDPGARRLVLGEDGPTIMVSNLKMEQAPDLDGRFPFGWQGIQGSLDVRPRWMRTAGGGKLQITFAPKPKRSDEFLWRLYALPLPPHDEAIVLRLRVTAEDASDSEYQFRAQRGSTRVATDRVRLPGREAASLEVVLPPSETGGVVSMSLWRRHWDTRDLREQVLSIGGLEVEPAARAPGEMGEEERE